MRSFFKAIYAWIGRLNNTVVSLVSICFFSSIKVSCQIKKNKVLGDKDCYVLGNGPSLREILNDSFRLQEIMESDSIVVNNFANSESFSIIKPLYYLLLDPEFYNDSIVRKKEEYQLLYNNLHKVDWDMTLFLVNRANVRLIQDYIDNPHVRVTKFNATRIVGFKHFQQMALNCNLGIPSSRNVIIPALFLMVNMGYKRIFLYGADFSWTKTLDVDVNNGKLFINDRHFYNNTDIIHYEKGGFLMWMESIAEMVRGINALADYAVFKKALIINRTKGSFIDAFIYENPEINNK